MNKFIKVLAISFSLILMSVSFAACGERAEKEGNNDNTQVSESSKPPEGSLEDTSRLTPEATPEVTLKATPEVTPQATSEATSKAIPEAASEATPKTTPETTPEANSQSPPEAATGVSPGLATESPKSNDVEVDKTLGVIDGSLYTNTFFKFSLKFPAKWAVATKEQLFAINKLGVEFIKENGTDNDAMNMAMAQVIPLFFASQYPLDYAEGTNANINVIAENISLVKAFVKTPKVYLNLAIQVIKAQGLDYNMGEITDERINGKDFARVDAVLVTDGTEVSQTMYVTLMDNHSLILTLTHFSDVDKKQLEDSLKSIVFK